MKADIVLGGEKRSIRGDYTRWVIEQIRNRRVANAPVEVIIDLGGELDLRFSCSDEPQNGRGGRSRTYSPKQQEIVDLWFRYELDKCPFELDSLMSFLSRLRHMV